MTKCIGCGVELQNKDKNQPGYVISGDICQRCFDITHYNKYIKAENKDYSKSLNNIDDLVLLVTDFLNLNNINLNTKTILVLTKADIIPRSIKKEKLLEKINNKNIVDKILVSSKNNYNFDKLYESILKHKITNKVYVVGYTNAGKSTLINKLSKNYGKQTNITVSNQPSTTLDLIENKINDDVTLIDTPGLLDDGNIIFEGKDIIKKVTPKKEIRPVSLQIKTKQSVLMDDILKIDFKDITNIIIYSNMNIQRIYKEKETPLVPHNIRMKNNQDLVIKGLGFITFKKQATITLYLPKNVKYTIRNSII